MAKTSLGEFKVSEMTGTERKNDRVLISIRYIGLSREQKDEIKSRLDNFIKDIGKYEMLVNGFSTCVDMGLPFKKQTKDITYLDLDFKKTKRFDYKDIVAKDMTEFYLYLYAKTDEITKQGKELSPDKINTMIENIEKYNATKDTLKLLKSEIEGGK